MSISVDLSDEINEAILKVSEDQIVGFHQYPFHEIAQKSGVSLNEVITRIRAMMEAGVIRRTRQTLLATKLAEGALVAWKLPEERLENAFNYLVKNDPFSGHVVLRSTDSEIPGFDFRLWTTLKVPQGVTLEEHCDILKRIIGADEYVLMPALGVFALGVGHIRRRALLPGDKNEKLPIMETTRRVELSPKEWEVLLALKREFSLEEVRESPWDDRAKEVGLSLEEFCQIASGLDEKRVIGRFSTFLEHVKPSHSGQRVTRFNGLFHWAVPDGMQERAGQEIGRHHCMTHCYWREGGKKFGGANIMGVVHGTQKDKVLEHKAAIDRHLKEVGIPVLYTAVFWGGKSEIKPSEISPVIYQKWQQEMKSATAIF